MYMHTQRDITPIARHFSYGYVRVLSPAPHTDSQAFIVRVLPPAPHTCCQSFLVLVSVGQRVSVVKVYQPVVAFTTTGGEMVVFENTLISNETQTEIIALVVLVFVVGMLLGLLKYVRA